MHWYEEQFSASVISLETLYSSIYSILNAFTQFAHYPCLTLLHSHWEYACSQDFQFCHSLSCIANGPGHCMLFIWLASPSPTIGSQFEGAAKPILLFIIILGSYTLNKHGLLQHTQNICQSQLQLNILPNSTSIAPSKCTECNYEMLPIKNIATFHIRILLLQSYKEENIATILYQTCTTDSRIPIYLK